MRRRDLKLPRPLRSKERTFFGIAANVGFGLMSDIALEMKKAAN
jgi:hypothetical protein